MASMYAESLRAFLKPVLPFMDDPSVSEIMINGPTEIWIEQKGKVKLTDAAFTDEGLRGAAMNMAQFVGRTLTEERPRLDARLPDGSRIHVVLPPIGRKGTTISIRKFFKDKLTIDKLIEFGSMTKEMARFIEGCVVIKENIVVAGGTGSGKTTLLNIVSTLIPNDERILTIEDSAELQLQQEHIVPFESRPPDKFGKGGVDMGDLLHSALRLRPDRIVVGEVRGGECFHLVQAMNTGHGGSMATTHANTPTDTLRRLESLCLQSGIDLPLVAVRAQVASAINMVICCERFQDGSRRTTEIAEVLPLNEKGEYRTQNIFTYIPTHKDPDGKIHGYHTPTGIIPNFVGRLRAYGFTDMTDEFFDPATYGLPPPPEMHATGVLTTWVKSLDYRSRGEADPEEVKEAQSHVEEIALQREKMYMEAANNFRKEQAARGPIYKAPRVSVAQFAAAMANKPEAAPAPAAEAPKPAPKPAEAPKTAPAPQAVAKPAHGDGAPARSAETSAPRSAPRPPPSREVSPGPARPAPQVPPRAPNRHVSEKIEISADLMEESSGEETMAPVSVRRPSPAPARPAADGGRPAPRPRPQGVMSSRRQASADQGQDDVDDASATNIGVDVRKLR
jgi:pilus assembly protein CpaF